MGEQLTLIADLEVGESRSVGTSIRPVEHSDLDALGRLYFESYDPGLACDTLDEAIDDIHASFDGEYGRLLQEPSLVAVDGDDLLGAVLTVHRAPWEGLPDCPLIIELFVARSHRRRGIGLGLVQGAMEALADMGERRVALRVNLDNRPALALYERLGFSTWSPADGS